MSVNVIAELHPLRSIRTKLTADPKPVADIIRELNSGFPLSQARACLNGEIVRDFSIIAHDGDTLWVKFVPHGGGGMKAGGWALALIGIAVTVATWGAGSPVGVALIGAGIGMIAGGTVLLNMNIPSLKDREKPEQDPSIRGGKNQARPHGRIPVLFGRHRVYPDLAANPHTSVIGNQQFFTQLFCGGYKDCTIDMGSIKLGETLLADLSQTGDIDQILAGADPLVRLEVLQNGEAPILYPHCVHEDAINAPLQHEIDDGNGGKLPGEIIRTTPDGADSVNVDIFFYNGLGEYANDGDLKTAFVEVRASYKKTSEGDSAYRPLGYFDHGSNILSGAELKTKRYQVTRAGLARGKYDVKVERVTPDSTDSKVIDQVYVGSIRSMKSECPILAERQKDLTVIALRVMATAKVNGVVDSFNYVATSKLPAYSGTGSGGLQWLAAAETRNPAAMLLCALRGRAAQQRVDDADIDWPSLEAFYRWCETHKYFCDAYLSESVTIAELLRMVGGTARAEALRIDSKISVVQDVERPAPAQLFTPKNTRGYGVTMFAADIPDAISLRFVNGASGYAQDELTVYDTPDGLRPGEPGTVQKVDLWGITNREQAWLVGRYSYACLRNRPFVHTIEVDIEYLLCNKGDWVQYAGDLALTGAAQGRITETLWSGDRCVGLRVDEPVEADAGKTYAVRLRLSDGSVLLRDVSVVRQPNEIYFTEPLAERDAPGPGGVYAYGVRGQEVIDLIITDIQPQADLCATLTCVEHAPAIFGVDDPNFVMPEFEDKITPVSGAVDSGIVGTARWKLFVTYHDAEWEPPRPSGDGQGGGWHWAHTTHALWQSSKTAESVDSGEWGPSVRVKGERSTADTVAIYLTLSPQAVILDTDGEGKILHGLLPCAVRAELFKWNHKIPIVEDMVWYPGEGGDIADPMPGDIVPAGGRSILFSLGGPGQDMARYPGEGGDIADPMPGDFAPVGESSPAPQPDATPKGITIDGDGVITIAANAALDGEHRVTVRACYGGEIYSAVLAIQVRRRAGESLYLGTIDTLPQGPEATILKGPAVGRVRALQGHYVLAIASGTVGGHVWKAGYVYQWTGVAWEERDPGRHSELYVRCLADGLAVEGLAQDMGWFVNLFCRMLIAQRAFIETLEAQVLKISGAIYGGDRYLPDGEENPGAAVGARGFWLGANGEAKLDGATVGGKITAHGGHFHEVSATDLKIKDGTIDVGPLHVSGLETGNTPDISHGGAMKVIDFVNYYIPEAPGQREKLSRTVVAYYGGTYGSSVLHSFVVEKESRWFSGERGGGYALVHTVTFYAGSKPVVRTTYENNPFTIDIGKDVLVKGGGSGKTFQLKGLPTTEPKGPDAKGTLWRDKYDNSLKIVPDD